MRKGAFFWNEHDTKVFCEICKEEKDAGNTDEGYLSAEGYNNVKLKFNAITDRGYVKKHFKYRWNSLKLEYARWLELVSSAGHGWDPEAGTFGADEDWWTNHIKINRWHAKFRNRPPDNLSLLDELFGKAHVGKSPAIPVEDSGEDKEEATRVNIDGSDEDAKLALSAMKKANLAKRKVSTPVVNVLTIEDKNLLQLEYKKEDLGEDKEEATRISIDGSGEDAELPPSAMKKAKLADRKDSSPMVDVLIQEDGNPLPLEYKEEDLGEDKEVATRVSIDGLDEDAELTPSAMKRARLADCKVSSPMVAELTTKEDKNPVPQKYKKASNALTATAEASSCDYSTVPTIREAVGLIRDCGVSEGTDLFYTATQIVAMNPEYRELFALIRTKEGRLDWLQRAHDDATMLVHFSTS